jgi:hypothetical protein
MKPKTITQNAKETKIIKTKNGDRLVCRIRKSQLVIKPEERFRQRLLNYLIDNLGYDEENIGVEVPMTHHKKGESGRADIVVFDKPYKNEGAKPLIVIECKNPENKKQVITDYGIEPQIHKYSTVLNQVFQIITNDRQVIGIDLRNQKILDHIPSLKEITKDKIRYIKPEPYHWDRYSYHCRLQKKNHKKNVDLGFIAGITESVKIPPILQLMDLIYDTDSSFNQIVLSEDYVLKEDLGLRLSNFGYAGSGGLIGNYRCLRLQQPDGNSRIIGYSIYPQGSWGTYLMISVDDRKGHALELQLDKFIRPTGKTTYQIFHTGVMTVGHKGRLKNEVVLKYVEKKAPFLLNEGKALLGTFDITKDLKFQQKEVKDFILRTATYAILRDKVRTMAFSKTKPEDSSGSSILNLLKNLVEVIGDEIGSFFEPDSGSGGDIGGGYDAGSDDYSSGDSGSGGNSDSGGGDF